MRHYKVTDGDKLLFIGIGAEGGEEITVEEYNRLLEQIKNTPIEIPIIEDGEPNEEFSD